MNNQYEKEQVEQRFKLAELSSTVVMVGSFFTLLAIIFGSDKAAIAMLAVFCLLMSVDRWVFKATMDRELRLLKELL